MSDDELRQEIKEKKITGVAAAVEMARDIQEAHLEQATNTRWGEDSDPELADMKAWRAARQKG